MIYLTKSYVLIHISKSDRGAPEVSETSGTDSTSATGGTTRDWSIDKAMEDSPLIENQTKDKNKF